MSPETLTWPTSFGVMSFVTTPSLPISALELVTILSFLFIFSAKGLVKHIRITESITKITVWAITFEINKLSKQVISAATPNQKTKNPTVAISAIKQTPEIINQICQGNI